MIGNTQSTKQLTPKAMRTLLITLLALTFGISSEAKPRANSQFNIRMADLSNYTVTFNNTTYFATEWVKINNVPPGKHYLRIEESMQTRGRGMRANGRRLIYQGWITVPAASVVNTRVNFNRNFAMAGIVRLDYGHGAGYNNGPQGNYPQQNPRPGVGYGNQQPQGNYPPQGGYNDQGNDQDGYDYGNPAPGPQDDGAYDDGTYGTSQLKATNPNQNKPTARPAVINKVKPAAK